MKKPIAISLSPNTFPQDTRLAADLLLKPRQWQRGPNRDKQGKCPADWLLFDSGRSALFCLLKAFGIGLGDEVLLQAFTCVAVPNPIIWVGAKPVYIDIDGRTLNLNVPDLRKKITARTKAVIVQHTFGLPASMEEIKQITDQHDLIVIEDCAHALGAKFQGQEVGTWGDAAFFSFGRDKAISSVAGGAAKISAKCKVQRARLEEEYEKLSYPPKLWVLQQLLYPALTELVLGVYNIGIGKALHHILLGTGIVARASTQGEKTKAQKPSRIPSKMPFALQLLMQSQLERLDTFNKRRSQIAAKYLTAGLKPAQPPTLDRIWLRFPMLVENPKELHSRAKKHGIFLGDWYDQVVAPGGVDLEVAGYKTGSCPVAEEVSKHIIDLPTYPRMTDKEVERVVAAVKSYGI